MRFLKPQWKQAKLPLTPSRNRVSNQTPLHQWGLVCASVCVFPQWHLSQIGWKSRWGVFVTVYKPSLEEWMCQITQRPPLGQSCRCTCGRVHVQNSLCTARNHVVITFPPSHSLFLCLIPLCFSSLIAQFCFPDLSTSASPSLTERTRPPPSLALQVP